MTADAIFADTMAEMTWEEVDAAARRGAIALWAFGVIEQHGPHLPAGTDVYLPSAMLRRVRALLVDAGVEAVIVPPYYWGVNVASGGFPASVKVRPDVMVELMADVFASLAGDGFRAVHCVTGHGDAHHNRTIHRAVTRSRAETGIDISFVAEEGLIKRLGIALTDPAVTPVSAAHDSGLGFPDVHAGKGETGAMLAVAPHLVRADKLAALPAVAFSAEDLAEWRQGFDVARRKTPLGYVGAPAKAEPGEGGRDMEAAARAVAQAIAARHAAGGPPHRV
ncbi:MAG TPA: creatininase family protein [Hyphomicrobiales bacterium]|nr:creatininase family protein [Hyphomicrobiales bacterium]